MLTLGKLCNIIHAHPYAGGQVLEHIFSEKDLGATFDSELTFEEHIMNKVKKENSMVGLIRRSFSYLSPDLFRQLYSTFVRPYLEYANYILTLEYRRAFGDMIEVYKHLHHYEISSIPTKFVARTRPSRKHNFELNRNFANDGLRGIQTNSFYYRSIVNWNNLPKEVVNSSSITIFKKRLNLAWQSLKIKTCN